MAPFLPALQLLLLLLPAERAKVRVPLANQSFRRAHVAPFMRLLRLLQLFLLNLLGCRVRVWYEYSTWCRIEIGGIGRDVPIPSGLEDPVGFADAPTLAAKDDRPVAKKKICPADEGLPAVGSVHALLWAGPRQLPTLGACLAASHRQFHSVMIIAGAPLLRAGSHWPPSIRWPFAGSHDRTGIFHRARSEWGIKACFKTFFEHFNL
jgi:hypothetical protein